MHTKALALALIFLVLPGSICADNAVCAAPQSRGNAKMAVINVATAAQLTSALAAVKAGDIIELAAGNYSSVTIKNLNPAAGITIRSANADNPAHFDYLEIQSSSNITLRDLDVGRTFGATENLSVAKVFKITGSHHITVDNTHFHGSQDGNVVNDGLGAEVSNSNNIVISNSEFEQFARALTVANSNYVEVIGNSFHDIRSDGMNVLASTFLTIDSNSFTNFYRSPGDHADAIQFWTANQPRASSDVIIRNNQMTQGIGNGFQGIFLRDETENMPFQRITIENNLIYLYEMSNGITVGGGEDINILNNTVISPEGGNAVWIRLARINGATVSGNVTDSFYHDYSNTTVALTDNVTLSDSANLRRSLTDLNAFGSAAIANLILPGVGYQFGGTGTAIVMPQPSPPPTDTGTVDPDPAPDPVVVVDPVPTPEETATANPTPAPAPSNPDPAPAPEPEEVAVIDPEPTPVPAPVPTPQPTPEEVAVVDPTPAPAPVTDPVSPAPVPTPEEVAVVDPSPVPAPVPTSPAATGFKRSAVIGVKSLSIGQSGQFAAATLADASASSTDPFALAAAYTSSGDVAISPIPRYDYLVAVGS